MTMKTMKTCIGCVFSALAASSFALGCSAQGDGEEQPQITFMAASDETRAGLGVARWGTYEEGAGRHILAFDEGGTALLDMRAEPNGADALRFTDPQHRTVTLGRDGSLDGSAPWSAVLSALYTDAKTRAFSPPGDERTTDEEPVASSEQALTTLVWQTDYPRSGGLFGYSETFDAGWGCFAGRHRDYADAYTVAGSTNCYVERWLSDDPTDCRVRLHIGISAFGGGTCRGLAYASY
jgi:hypothetical protein